MIKLMLLLFIVIAPTLAGILVVGVLAMSSPTDGGSMLSSAGSTLAMVVGGAFIAALPISYVVANMLDKAIKS